jgi:apolipoprotein N-acyltransferase
VNFALTIFSALLLILIFPRFDFTWLAPVALTPLLISCARESSWQRRFLEGWAGGFVFWFGICYWIQFVLEVHGGMGRWGGWGTFFLFAILKGLHMAVFAALAGFVIHRWWAVPATAALWTGLERTHGPFGFAWLDLGNAGIDMPVAMRLAPVTGVYGLSFVFAMTACAVALIVIRRPRRELAWLLMLPLISVLPAPAVVPATRQALVVQPNIDSEVEWSRPLLDQTEQQLFYASGTYNLSPNPDLIIWPEMPVPLYLNDPAFMRYATGLAQWYRAHFLFGAVGRTKKGQPLNSAMMIDPSGRVLDQYDKIKLVPFGEFVPDVFSFVNRVTKEAGDFEAGSRVVVFPNRVGAFICYESAFPDLVRRFAQGGAEVFVNLSNDGYFGTSAAHEQHLELVRMRAAENARWIVRATNDGITATVDPTGRVTERLRPFTQLSATMHYGTSTNQTPYTRHGDWFAWSCLVVGIGACGIRKRQSSGPSQPTA